MPKIFLYPFGLSRAANGPMLPDTSSTKTKLGSTGLSTVNFVSLRFPSLFLKFWKSGWFYKYQDKKSTPLTVF